MARECGDVLNLYYTLVSEGLFDRSTVNQLNTAIKHIVYAAPLLLDLDTVQPENGISSQLTPLFLETRDALCDICSRLKDQDRRSDAIGMTLQVLKMIKPEVIAGRIKASKPSTFRSSGSQITAEMVGFVNALLGWACRFGHLFFGEQILEPPLSVLLKKLKYLQVIIKLTTKACIEHEIMKDLFRHVEDIAYFAITLYFSWLAVVDRMHELDICELSEVMESLSPSSPELRQIYLSVLTELKSSRSETTMTAENIIQVVDALQLDLNELRSGDLEGPFGHQIWYLLKGGLPFLSEFLQLKQFNELPRRISVSLQLYVGALTIDVATVIYSPYDQEMDKTTGIDRAHYLFKLKFNIVKVETMMIMLLDPQINKIGLPKNLIDFVLEELIFLGTFLMDSLEQCKEHTKISDLLALIRSLIDQIWRAINSLSHVSKLEKWAREYTLLHFQFLLRFKFIKALIRQMCPNISDPLRPDLPAIYLLNFLPINFEVIGSYLSMLKSSKSSSSDILTIDEVLMGFHEYIIYNLLLKDDTYLTFAVTNKVKKFFHGLLLLVTYLVDPLVQCIGCKKKNDLLTESAICLIYEDAVDSNKSRKVNLVLQFLTIAFKLIESEERLTDLLKRKATLEDETIDLIESAREELISFGAFLMDVLRQHTELNELHDLLNDAEVIVHKVARMGISCYESIMKGSSSEKMRPSLCDLLQEIESIKVASRNVCFQLLDASPYNLIDGEGLINFLLNDEDRLSNCDACSISFLKNQILGVKDKLVYMGSFLADIVKYRDMHQDLIDLVRRVQDRKYACLFTVRDYRPAWYYMFYLSDVKQLLKFVDIEVQRICLKVPDSSSYSFPKTNGLGFLVYFVGKLKELLSSKLDSVIDLKLQIESINVVFLRLRLLAVQFADSFNEDDEVYKPIASVIELAYKAEYVIDSCLACSHPLWYKVLWISEVIEDIKLVNKIVSESCERKEIDVTVHKVKKTSTDLTLSLLANTLRSNEETEFFQEAMDHIKKKLLKGSSQLDVISLVGMPGIGKTTLAEKIYNDPIITSHFSVRAQCRVTQVYSWRDLLLTILNCVLEPVNRNEKDDGELANELRRFLLTKRFLVLIDDVWDNEVWDNFNMCFNSARYGSRIILTTRLSNVASYAKCISEPYHLRLFNDDESWTLLQKKVFQGESCPPELVDVGFRIAKCCEGLPLFIALVAGVLKEKKGKAELWQDIEKSLVSQTIGSMEESMFMIGFSYKNLPDQLKPCFLYFGGLLKGKDIHVSKLIRLWVAEGFVQANMEKGPEDEAFGLLEDLIGRNLVIDVEKKTNGKLKMCRVHDLLHKFCLEKAKQEDFFLRINRFSGEDILIEKPTEYRLFVHSYEDQIDLWHPSCSTVRSLLFNVIDPGNVLWPCDISFIFDSFKLVKVLDLESINIGGVFPSQIQYLIHLRYFSTQIDGNSIPSSIAKLWNLETFVVTGLGGEVILPSSLLKMVKLRHVHVNHRASFSLYENMAESLANLQLNNLETFSCPRLSYGEDTDMILRKMPNLRKLSCIVSGTFGYSEKKKERCVLFPRLEYLSHLESLKLASNSFPSKLPHVFSFPLRLRKLTLSKFRLPWSQISAIGELPNLEILKLVLRAFKGDVWEVKDSEFSELKYLALDDLNIARWSVTEDAFPKLERLVLTKCKRLEKIPSHFDDVVSLRSIEVNWCSWSVANSAEEIRKTQHEDMANDAFRVTIQPSDWARRSHS